MLPLPIRENVLNFAPAPGNTHQCVVKMARHTAMIAMLVVWASTFHTKANVLVLATECMHQCVARMVLPMATPALLDALVSPITNQELVPGPRMRTRTRNEDMS